MVFYHSMNAGSAVGIPRGGGDTQTLLYAKEFALTFCTHRWQGANAQATTPGRAIWRNFHNLILN